MFLSSFVHSFCQRISAFAGRARRRNRKSAAARKRAGWSLGRVVESLETRSLLTTLTHTLELPDPDSNITDWVASGNIPQFDPALGTLNSVSITETYFVVTTLDIENLSTSAAPSNNPRVVTANFNAAFSLSGPGAALTNGLSIGPDVLTASLFRNDGTSDYTGNDSAHFGPFSLDDTQSVVLTSASDLAAYLGTGSVVFTGNATARTILSTNSNVHFQVLTTAEALITVTYDYTPNSVSGYVYHDANNDGQRTGETGIQNVTVTLTGTDDLSNPVSLTTTTNAAGFYEFTNLRPGNYTITETQPSAYLDGKDTIGTPGGVTGNDVFTNVVITPGTNGIENNFGEILPGSLSGFVYVDTNDNGLHSDDVGNGLQGVLLTLTGTDDLGVITTQTTYTAIDGSYSFNNLRPGSYTVTETQPAGYLDGKDALVNSVIAGSSSTDIVSSIPVVQSANTPNNNFGELLPASISGYVYVDKNNDGIKQATELPIPGTTVTLTGTDDLGNDINQFFVTDSFGFYSFTDLRPGAYTLTETQPADYYDGKDTIGSQGGDTLDDVFTNINLFQGTNGVQNNFGELEGVTLGNYVWRDSNGNGLQDPDEEGIDDVEVLITYAGEDGDLTTTDDNIITTVTTSTVAGVAGQYLHTGAPGVYQVQFVNPGNGYQFTVANAGDDTLDSDADMVTGIVAAVTLASGDVNLTLDAGLVYAGIDVEKYVKEKTVTVICDYEGFTPGYWKQCQHFNDWVGYSPNQKFNSVFGVNDPRGNSLTLLQALSSGGGSYMAMARHAVAALLNASHSKVAYLYSVEQVIGMVQSAYANRDFEETKNLFAAQNELGGDIRHGGKTVTTTTDTSGLGIDADSAPGLSTTVGKQLIYNITVTNTGDVPLSNVVVRDDNGTVSTSDDFNPAPVLSSGFNVGDLNKDNRLDTDEVWYYTYEHTATAGVRRNLATASAQPVATNGTSIGSRVTDEDPAYYSTPETKGSISGTKYLDVTGNGLTSDDTALGGVTIKLFQDRDNNGVLNSADGSAVATAVTKNSDGTYSFGNLSNGRYFVQEVVPEGYVRTAPTLDAYYTVQVVGGTVSTGNDFANAKADSCDCDLYCVQYYINGCSTPVSDLRGRVDQGDVVEVKFSYSGRTPATYTLVSYTAPSASFSANNAHLQQIFDVDTKTVTSGTYRLKVVVPNSYFQIDFVCGQAIDKFGPAGSNIFYSAQKRLISADNDGSRAAAKSSLSGYVYLDSNNNGSKSSSERGIANVTIQLTGVDIFGNTVSLTTKTDSNGFYKFNNLNASNLSGYKIREITPSGYADGRESVGSLGGNVGNDYFVVFVNTNSSGVNYNFGERRC